jgi:hypothetical protein
MIDWKFNFDDAPRTGKPVLIWYRDHAWQSAWNRLENRWECLSRRDVPEAWAELNEPVKPPAVTFEGVPVKLPPGVTVVISLPPGVLS